MKFTTQAQVYAYLEAENRRRNEAYELTEVIKDGRRYFGCLHKATGLSPQAMDIEAELRRKS